MRSRFIRLLSAVTTLCLTAIIVLVGAPQLSAAPPICTSGVVVVTALAGEATSDEKEYALIFGTVWGPGNRPVYGVPIKIRRSNEKKARWQGMSDHRGEFAQRVPAGKAEYIVWADIKTPKGKEKPQVKVAIENDERADISLHLTE
jgi:hypothetical protein